MMSVPNTCLCCKIIVHKEKGFNEGVTCSHLLVLLPSVVCPEVLLDDDGGRPHLEEPPAAVPAPNAPLEDQDLPGQDPIALLLQEQVLVVSVIKSFTAVSYEFS